MQPVQPLPWTPREGLPGLYDADGNVVSFTRNAAFIEHMAARWVADGRHQQRHAVTKGEPAP